MIRSVPGRTPRIHPGAWVDPAAQVGAGALVPPGKVVPSGWLVVGVPARPVRKMSQAELDDIARNATDDIALWKRDDGGTSAP